MQNFLNYDRSEPNKRDVFKRLKDFNEVYEVFSKNRASIQADRCVQCGDPYCLDACPLGNFIPHWLKKSSKKDVEFAFKISNDTSPFPEIMGRVCPQDVLCEGSCTLNDGYGAITIGSIETFISEEGFKNGLKPEFATKMSDKRVAVIGSGPASLSTATFLLRSGIGVEMFERDDKAGGLLTYGIPGFKLEKEVIQRRVDWLIEAGMKLHLNTEVGKDIELKDIINDFDAVFIGIGATKGKYAGLENEDAKGVFLAMELLKDIQKANFNPKHKKEVNVKDKNVVVIGGGDTAMDCVRTSVREGAKSVTCIYRRDEANMPGSKKEYLNAIEEGVEFTFNVSPKEIVVDKDKNIVAIELLKTKLGEKDATGRQKMKIMQGSEFKLQADIIISALGFSQEKPLFLEKNGIELDKWDGVKINENYQTSNPKVYAGGDCYRGADLVVRAAKDGRDAARVIAKKLFPQ